MLKVQVLFLWISMFKTVQFALELTFLYFIVIATSEIKKDKLFMYNRI